MGVYVHVVCVCVRLQVRVWRVWCVRISGRCLLYVCMGARFATTASTVQLSGVSVHCRIGRDLSVHNLETG